MMRQLSGVFLVLIFVVTISAQTAPETSKPAEKTKYDLLVEKVKQKPFKWQDRKKQP